MTSNPAGPAAAGREAARLLRVPGQDGYEALTTGDVRRLLRRVDTRLGKLEAWVEMVMRTLATLGLESLLIELDEARGADYDASESRAAGKQGTQREPCPGSAWRRGARPASVRGA